MKSTILVLLLTIGFCSTIVIADSEPYPFPCQLNHGCVCNHTTITRNLFDGQYYGTCTSCAKGWVGSFCDTIDLPCLNGGTLHNNSGLALFYGSALGNQSTQCDCPISWTGSSCQLLQCPNSVGGHGPDHIQPVNAMTNMCTDCEAGWGGVSCMSCQNNAVCSRYAGEDGVCDTSFLVRGASKRLECTLGEQFAKVLGHNVTGRVTMDCNSRQPTQSFAMSNEGTCTVAFFRIEENVSFMDPFFYCTATNCSLVIQQQAVADSAKNHATVLAKVLRSIGQTALLLGCIVVALAGQYGRFVLGKHMSNFFVIVVAIVLWVLLNGYCFVMLIVMNSDNAVVKNTITYHCEATSCLCGPDTPYTPVCSTSPFGEQIIPRIRHGIDLTCDSAGSSCSFTPADVQTRIPLECSATECVSTSAFPYVPSIAGVPQGSAIHQGIDVMTLTIVGGIVLTVIFLMHMYVTVKRTRALSLEFQRLFLARRGGPAAPLQQRRGRRQGPGSTLSEAELRTVPDEEDNDLDDGHPSAGNYSMINADDTDDVPPPAVGTPYRQGQYVSSTAAQSHPAGDDEEHDDDDESAAFLPPNNAYQQLPTDESSGDQVAVDAGLPGLHRDEVWTAMAAPIELKLSNVSYKLPSNPVAQYFTTLFGEQLRRGDDAAEAHEESQNNGKQILTDVTFSVRSGQLLALMGPSGAGKTTLLDLLACRLGRNGVVGGTLSINGVPLNTPRRRREYRHMVGYVSQEDILLPSLTVRETLWYAAKLKLPWAFSNETIHQIIDILIETLKLKQCEHTIIGNGSVESRGISGGEKRRVSIAVELVANPRILFLDEPTSGLDAVSARSVMEAIAQLSSNSRLKAFAPHFFAFQPLVIFSIHQPSAEIYQLFDKVLLLSRGIAVMYGDARTAVNCLTTSLEVIRESVHDDHRHDLLTQLANSGSATNNPAEVLMNIEDTLNDDDRVALRLAAHQAQNTSTAANLVEEGVAFNVGKVVLRLAIDSRRFYPNTWIQLYLLTRRSITCLLGSFHLVACHALVTLFVGALMCVLYEAESLDLPGALNRAGSVTFLLLVIAFISLSSLEQLIVERKLFASERDNGYYSTFPYILSKMLVDIFPLRVFFVSILASVIYFPMGLRTDVGFHFLWFLSIVSCFSVCVTLVTMCVGIIFGSFGASALVSVVIFLWSFVFGGLMVQSDTIPAMLRIFRFLSPFFLAFESILVNELDGQMCTFAPTDATGQPSGIEIPLFCAQYLQNLGLHPDRFGSDVVSLGLMCVFLFFSLWFLTYATISAKR